MYVVYTTLFQWLHCAISLFAFCHCNFLFRWINSAIYRWRFGIFRYILFTELIHVHDIVTQRVVFAASNSFVSFYILWHFISSCSFISFWSHIPFRTIFSGCCKSTFQCYKWKSLRIRCEISHSQINHKSLLQMRSKWVRCIFKIHLKTEKIVSKDKEYACCAQIFM